VITARVGGVLGLGSVWIGGPLWHGVLWGRSRRRSCTWPSTGMGPAGRSVAAGGDRSEADGKFHSSESPYKVPAHQ
jgi:hypothetical protein